MICKALIDTLTISIDPCENPKKKNFTALTSLILPFESELKYLSFRVFNDTLGLHYL